MEDVACDKEIIHKKRKKKKGRLKFEENYLSELDEKRKSTSRKRKKCGNEDYETQIYEKRMKRKEGLKFEENHLSECDENKKSTSRKRERSGNEDYEKQKTSKKCADDIIPYLNQSDFFKKEKKKKLPSLEKADLEENYETCQIHDAKKYKKKKKRSKLDKEISKIQKVNEIESRILIEGNNEIINPGNNAEIIDSNNTEGINSLYSNTYTMDSERLGSEKNKPRSQNKRQYKPQMYEDYIYKSADNEETPCGKIETIPESCSYWVRQNSVYDIESYPQEAIQKDLLERIEYITDYFDRFDIDNLTEEECQEKELSNFNGPYLPTPQHKKFFGDLNIEIDWEVPAEQHLLFAYSSNETIKERGLSFVRHPFVKAEDNILLDNWRKFQEQYKFYDLRPLLGIRSMRVNCEDGQYIFERVQYIDSKERYKFLLYMARGLTKRTRRMVSKRMDEIVMRLQDKEIIYTSTPFESREVVEIEAFIKLFGAHWRGMEFLLGRTTATAYRNFGKRFIKYKNVPIRHGHWQSTEVSRLVRALFRTTNASSVQELLKVSNVAWNEVFPLMQTRLHFQCQSYFKNVLKWKLELASYLANHQAEVYKLYWTSDDVIKLFRLVSENLGPTVNETDWEKISTHFEVFGPNCCCVRFYASYQVHVPHKERSSFRAGVDYLITNIVPKIEKGLIVFRGEFGYKELKSLPLKREQTSNSSHDWSIKDTIKLINIIYECAGSSVETTSWSEISSHFKNYDEKGCKNHFRYLYFNRVPHKHRVSFDSALEYLKKVIYPMLKQKKQKNKREFLLTKEIANFSAEDCSILQALHNDTSQADDDDDVAMLL